MLISYWGSDDYNQNIYEEQIKDKCYGALMGNMLSKLWPNTYSLANVEIETINRCNNDCSFCPANRNKDIRHTTKMSEELFRKIIDDLADMDYRGRISLFSNDEPLLDNRIFDFLDYAKKRLPNAYHSLFTNGILMDEEKYRALIDKLDYLRINNYNDALVLDDNIEDIYKKNIDEKKCKVVVEVRKKNQILLNRGGLSPNNSQSYGFSFACILPFIQMVIRPDGKVSRCCQDVYGNETLGDLNVNTIGEIWNGNKYREYRRIMLLGEHEKTPYCNECDIKGLTSYYPKEWEYLYFEGVLEIIKKAYCAGRKIVLINVLATQTLITVLNMQGIFCECSFSDSDIEYYMSDEKYFVVLGDLNHALSVVDKYKKKPTEDYIIYDRDLINVERYYTEHRNEEKERLITASKEGSLIIFGAGNIARHAFESYNLKPLDIIDNRKFGEDFKGMCIKKPEDIKDYTDKSVFIASYNYIDMVRQMNALGVSSSQLILANKFLL